MGIPNRRPKGTVVENGVPPLVFQFQPEGSPVNYDLMREVLIDQDQLQEALREQPSKFAFIASAHAAFEGAVASAKLELDFLEARLYTSYKEVDPETGKLPTEKALEAMIKSSKKWIDAKQRLRDLEDLSTRLKVCVEAMRHRRDSLVSLTSLVRTELELDLTRLKTQYDEVKGG